MNSLTIPEKDKERLIEICKTIAPSCEIHECSDCPYFKKQHPDCKAELIADTLISNGAIISFKQGKTKETPKN